jgi:hypothetical protein
MAPPDRPRFPPRDGPRDGPHGGPRDHGRGGPRDRGSFSPRREGFVPRGPTVPPEPVHAVRLREGDREVEISGSAAFVQATLQDLPQLLSRLRGEARGSQPGISLPQPPGGRVVDPPASPPTSPGAPATPSGSSLPPESSRGSSTATVAASASLPAKPSPAVGGNGATSLESRVLAILTDAERPLEIAEIRRRLAEPVSGQQVRRILERAADRVVSVGGRPAAYRLR